MRWIVLSAALALAPSAWCQDRLTERIEQIRRDMGARRIAVAFRDHGSGRRHALREHDMFSAASMIKVAVMVAAHDGAERGRFSLDTPVRVVNRFPRTGGGACRETELDRDVHAALGAVLSVGQLTEAMVAASSNLATNCLLQFIGLERAGASFDALGLPGMRLGSGMGRGSSSGANLVSAAGFEELFSRLHEGGVISPEASRQMLAHLFAQKISNGIPSGLPAHLKRKVRIAHKTGNIPTVEHDAGLVYLPGRAPYALAILTSWPGRGDDHPAALVRVTEAVHEELVERPAR